MAQVTGVIPTTGSGSGIIPKKQELPTPKTEIKPQSSQDVLNSFNDAMNDNFVSSFATVSFPQLELRVTQEMQKMERETEDREELLDKAVEKVVSDLDKEGKIKDPEEIIDVTTEQIEEYISEGVYETVLKIKEIRRRSVTEKERKLGKAEKIDEKANSRIRKELEKFSLKNKGFGLSFKELSRITSGAKAGKDMNAEKVLDEYEKLLDRIPSDQQKEIEVVAGELRKPGASIEKAMKELLENAQKRIRQARKAAGIIDGIEDDKEKLKKMGKEEAFNEITKNFQKERERIQEEIKDMNKLLDEINKLTKAGPEEFDKKKRELFRDKPEILDEIEKRKVNESVAFIKDRIKRFREEGGKYGIIQQKLKEFQSFAENAVQGIKGVIEKFGKGDQAAVEEMQKKDAIEGIEYARKYSVEKMLKLKGNEDYWKDKYRKLSECLQDPSKSGEFAELVKETIRERPKLSAMIGKGKTPEEVVASIKSLADENAKISKEWQATAEKIDSISNEVKKKWNETAGLAEKTRPIAKIEIPKEKAGWQEIEGLLDKSKKFIAFCKDEGAFWEDVMKVISPLRDNPGKFYGKLGELLKDRPEYFNHLKKINVEEGMGYLRNVIDSYRVNPSLEMLDFIISIYPEYDQGKFFEKIGYLKEDLEDVSDNYERLLQAISSEDDRDRIITSLTEIALKSPSRMRKKLRNFIKCCKSGAWGRSKIVYEAERKFRPEKLVYETLSSGLGTAIERQDYTLVDEMADLITQNIDRMHTLADRISGISANDGAEKANLDDLLESICKEMLRANLKRKPFA